MEDARITPSRWFYVLAGVVFAAGIALFGLVLYQGLGGMGAKLQQALAPGETNLKLSEPGTYTIFHEYESVFNEKVYSTHESISGLECTLVSKANGARVRLSTSAVNTTYEFGNRSGRSVFDFRIERPGVYTLSASYPQGKQGPEVVLAVGKGITAGILVAVIGGLASFFGSIAIALAITLVTLIKRSNKTKLLLAHPDRGQSRIPITPKI